MKIRTVVLATGLCISLLTAGCAGAVAGQAEIVSGAVLPTTSQSAPSPFPEPSSSGSSGSGSSSSSGSSGSGSSSSSDSSSSSGSSDSISESTDGSTAVTTQDTGTTPTSTDDSSTGPTSIPGLPKDCNAVLAGITAFSDVLQGAGSSQKISQATVDKALEQLPASGLPAQPQADITVLRATVSGAAGKTLTELGETMTDGKVVGALKDLSSWAQDNCG